MSLSLRSPLLTGLGFRHGFSLRAGGVSAAPFGTLNLGRTVGDDPAAVAENLLRLADDIGYAPERLYEVSQVHGARVEHAAAELSPDEFRARQADALVSGTAGCAVAVKVADCVAVLLADPQSGAVAAAHAGWRGVVADVVGAAIQALGERHHAAPWNLRAAIFPCIGTSAFEVGDEVAAQLVAAVGSAEVMRVEARPGAGEQRVEQSRELGPEPARPHVDLALSVRLQLLRAGLAADSVETVAGCTFSEPERFFSFRRDGGVTGRHLAAIVPRC